MSAARRIASLFAAYAVALQLMLLPLAVATGTADAALPGAHCVPDGTGQHRNDASPCCGPGCACPCQQPAVAAAASPSVEPVRRGAAWSVATAVRETPALAPERAVRARGPPDFGRA